MTDLIEKLKAALDEDERVAREACDNDSGEWFMGRKWNIYRAEELDPGGDEEHQLVTWGNVKSQSEHIARHDPARVLRHAATCRKVVGLHKRYWPFDGQAPHATPWTAQCSQCWNDSTIADLKSQPVPSRAPWPCPTLLAIAEAYGIEP